MRSVENQIIYVTLIVCTLIGGCRRSASSDSDEMIPQVEGRWIGHIHPIELYDAEGGIYHGATLEIAAGPKLPEAVPQELGGGNAPILTENVESNFRIVQASTLPLGKKVEVKGLMVVYGATAPYRASPYGDISANRRRYTERVYPEHIIVIKGSPKVLEP